MFDSLVAEAALFFLLFARVMGLLMTAPILSSSSVPFVTRGGFGFFITVTLFTVVSRDLFLPIPDSALLYTFHLLAEVLLGIALGLALQIIFAIFMTAGQLFSLQMGFGASQAFDPLSEVEIPLIGQLLNLIAMYLFLTIDGILILFFKGLYYSFMKVSSFAFIKGIESTTEFFTFITGEIFHQALLLAFPIMGILFLLSVTLGLLGRAAPQMNLLMLGFPVQIGVGFIIIMATLPFIIERGIWLFNRGFNTIETLWGVIAALL